MTQNDPNVIVRPAFTDRRNRNQQAPYVTGDGVVLVDRRGSKNTYTIFGQYTYRAWTESDPKVPDHCHAWYEILKSDSATLLSGPFQLSQQFAREDDAFIAVAQKVKWDIFHMVGSQAAQIRQ